MDKAKQKEIVTRRLKLRFCRKEDALIIKSLCNNYNLYKSTLTLPFPYTIEDATLWMKSHRENFEQDKRYEFAVTDLETGTLYGAVALTPNKQHAHGELAYWIGEPYWGKGIGTEAAQAMVEFAFQEKQLHKVFARFFKSNPASGRIMEKIGMKQEGVLREHVWKENRFEDLVLYGILNSSERST
ncbi:GNAT family N-acetyltransferase [Alkalihalobacillus sp. LMS6]|uniref:GNAT family N-acetyltransferase n=1 Tax=Alkalihalobacillus sp. LMS6 TaxID=2924034 RepID=UPI0020D18EBF|nr:GNAT family N-acetyltransferase [Alkalihalobacillus sp. LMS6]UTR06677.1 GNAT family N-acetyltransferase [Alkalihalobacillus sp. LMS6]